MTHPFPIFTADQAVHATLPRLAGAPEPSLLQSGAKQSWACRTLAPGRFAAILDRREKPSPGDVALVQVEEVQSHTRIVNQRSERLTLYRGDRMLCVFGNRYATDAFEAEISGLDDLSLLTAGGMIGTVISSHSSMKSPTRVSFVGYAGDRQGEIINLKRRNFPRIAQPSNAPAVVLVLGTGMNSGKTTTMARLTRALCDRGLRPAAMKLTGSVSPRDTGELTSAGAVMVRDFSDYGFPSTYLADPDEIRGLFESMIRDCQDVSPDVLLVEVADGVLQRETEMIMNDTDIRQRVSGVVLSAGCAPSGLFGVERIQACGHRLIAVSGLITSSPLFVREFQQHCSVPIASSTGEAEELAGLVSSALIMDHRVAGVAV